MTKLNLSKNGLLTKEGGRALGNMLLKELDVSNSGYGMISDKDASGFAEGISEGLAGNGALTKLDIRGNHMHRRVVRELGLQRICTAAGIKLAI
jgi:hypothetical protein